MTSKTTTKATSPRTSSPRTNRRKSQKKSNRINRQRRLQKQLQALLLERHSRRCIICHHPERDAIEEEFVHWRSPSRLAHDYKLGDYRTIYRHARAAGLLLQRRERLHSALDAFVESVDDVTFTGDTILRAMRAYSCIDSHGRWTEIPTQVQFSTSHDAHPPQPHSRTSNVSSDVIDIDPGEESEENEDNVPEEQVTAYDVLDVIRKYSSQVSRSDATACSVSPKIKSPSDATSCAASPSQALPRAVVRGQNPNDRSSSDRTACAASPRPSRGTPAQPAAPPKPKPDADGFIWHPRPGYPDQEISEPNAQGRVAYKIHMTTAASQLPSRETDARRAAELIYRSVIKKYGNP